MLENEKDFFHELIMKKREEYSLGADIGFAEATV